MTVVVARHVLSEPAPVGLKTPPSPDMVKPQLDRGVIFSQMLVIVQYCFVITGDVGYSIIFLDDVPLFRDNDLMVLVRT
jgi:hypothetical protein